MSSYSNSEPPLDIAGIETTSGQAEAFKQTSLHGVWAAIPLPWQEDDTLDTGLLREIVRRYHAAGVHGVYTTGTDGEFSALDTDDFRTLVEPFAHAVHEIGIPAQVGVTWLHTRGVLERIAYARDHGIDCIQTALPFWEPLNDREMVGFFADIAARFSDIGIVHYNIARAGRFLGGADYRKILPETPTLIGSKHTGGDPAALLDVVQHAPQMHHFVVDGQIMPGALLGARGFYSFMANLNPTWTADWWAACERRDWEEVTRRRVVMSAFFRDWKTIWGDVTASMSLAKLAARCGIAPEISLRVRPPYLCATEYQVADTRALIEKSYTELSYRPL